MNTLYKAIMDKVVEKTNSDLKSTFEITREMSEKIYVIPPHRTRYLSEIAESNRHYDETVDPRTSSSKNYMVFSKQ
jgi:methylmalonyl-CoA mutase